MVWTPPGKPPESVSARPKGRKSTAAPPNIGPAPEGQGHCLQHSAGVGYEWLNSRRQNGNSGEERRAHRSRCDLMPDCAPRRDRRRGLDYVELQTRERGAHVTAAVVGDFTFYFHAGDRSRNCARTECKHHRSTGLKCLPLSERRFELRKWRLIRSEKTAQAKTSQTRG